MFEMLFCKKFFFLWHKKAEKQYPHIKSKEKLWYLVWYSISISLRLFIILLTTLNKTQQTTIIQGSPLMWILDFLFWKIFLYNAFIVFYYNEFYYILKHIHKFVANILVLLQKILYIVGELSRGWIYQQSSIFLDVLRKNHSLRAKKIAWLVLKIKI